MNANRTRRVAIYSRVSTSSQNAENQVRELQQVAERQIVTEFKDDGISGAKGRDQCPGLDAMMQAVARREIDMVMAWSVDRLGPFVTEPGRVVGRAARQARRSVSAPARHRHIDAGREGVVSNDGRVR